MKLTDDGKRLLFSDDQDNFIGELAYDTTTDNEIIICQHVLVSDTYQGKGIGGKLILHLIDLAQQKHMKIYPLCPFAKKFFDTHPKYDELNSNKI